MSNNNHKEPRYLVMDIVFYAGSLNYDQGSGNYQELKKITMYDGSVRILVSRWALRYSMLETGKNVFGEEKWKLAAHPKIQIPGSDEKAPPQLFLKEFFDLNKLRDLNEKLKKNSKDKGPLASHIEKVERNEIEDKDVRKHLQEIISRLVNLKDDEKQKDDIKKMANEIYYNGIKKALSEFPEFDLFGFMITLGGENAIVRTTPVKISHAISLNTYNFDNQFMANLGIAKRGKSTPNPVNIEEFYGFYVYNITVDLQRIGILDDDPSQALEEKIRKGRVSQLIDVAMNLKRDIKGKREDLSPWLVVAGVYDDMNYDTYMDRIELVKSERQRVKWFEKKEEKNGGVIKEIEYMSEVDGRPKFRLNLSSGNDSLLVFARKNIEIEDCSAQEIDKNKFIEGLKEKLGVDSNDSI